MDSSGEKLKFKSSKNLGTGKSLSEVCFFASINLQYISQEIVHGITSSVHENYKRRTWAEHVGYVVDARRSASEKDLPVS